MTGFNNNGKFVPQAPKTFQVLELKDQQQQQPVKNSPLSVAARSKIINRSGSNYFSENQNGYGPMETTVKSAGNHCSPNESTYRILISLKGDYFLGDGKGFLAIFGIGGKIKDQEFIRQIQKGIDKFKSGKFKVWKYTSSSRGFNVPRERTEQCIEYEDYFKDSLETLLEELKEAPHYGDRSFNYTLIKP